MSGKRKDNYEVGYGRPPVETRFQKGQSGNPSGKRKGERNTRTLIQREGDEFIELREGGAVRRITKREAVVKALVQKAMKGDVHAFRELVAQGLLGETKATTAEPYALSEADLGALTCHADWVALIDQAKAGDETDEPD